MSLAKEAINIDNFNKLDSTRKSRAVWRLARLVSGDHKGPKPGTSLAAGRALVGLGEAGHKHVTTTAGWVKKNHGATSKFLDDRYSARKILKSE